MQLNELIKQETVRDVIKRTHVSKNLLDKLSNGEFYDLNRSQVIGILSILEREYGVELNETRDEATIHFDEKSSYDNNRFVVMEPVVQENNFLSKFFVLLLIGVITYGSWYFFSSYYRPVSHDIETKNEKSILDIIIAGKDTIMEKVNGKSSKDTTVVLAIEEENLSAVASTPVEKIDIQEVEVTTKSSEATDQNDTPLQDSNISKVPKEDTVIVSQKSETAQDTSAIKREKITILPQKIMLFQLVNLNTKKEFRFKRKEQYDIDLKENGWLFRTENSVFAFIDNDIFEEYGGSGKIFFKLDQDGIHQLSEDEYKEALRG